MNEIIEVPDIAVVKTIDSVKQLCSLRDQKIKKDTLQNFTTGSGIIKDNVLYVLSDYLIELDIEGPRINMNIVVYENNGQYWYFDAGDGSPVMNGPIKHVFVDNKDKHTVRFVGTHDAMGSIACYGTADMKIRNIRFNINTMFGQIIVPNHKLSTLDITNCPNVCEINIKGNPIFITDEEKKQFMASLPDRTGYELSGKVISDIIITQELSNILTTKNWTWHN